MNVAIKQGDILVSPMQTITNTINCKGVMGAGLALRFKERYPRMFDDYVARCTRKEVTVGHPYLYKANDLPWILNFPTKNDWRKPSKIEYVQQELRDLADAYHEWGITSLAIPALGCGNGGLRWSDVGPIMYHVLCSFTIPVEIYAPLDVPPHELTPAFLGQSADVDTLPASGAKLHVEQLTLLGEPEGETPTDNARKRKRTPTSRSR